MPGASVDFDSLVKSPSLFPFHLCRVYPEQLSESGRLEVIRHGIEDVLVRLRPNTTTKKTFGRLAKEASYASLYDGNDIPDGFEDEL
jgi:hypothetical protein